MTRQRNCYYPDLVGSDILKQIGIQGVTTTGIHNVPALNITGITTTDQPNPQALTLDTNFEGTDVSRGSRSSVGCQSSSNSCHRLYKTIQRKQGSELEIITNSTNAYGAIESRPSIARVE